MAEAVFIRPLVAADLDLLELLYEDPDEAGQFGFFGYQNPGGLHRDFAAGGLISDDHGRLAVALRGPAKTGEFIGEVSWHKAQTGPSSHSWTIGIALLVRARGHGYGTQAQRLLAEYLFAHTQLNRIAAETEVDNLAEQRCWRKPASPAKASCAVPASAPDNGATWRRIPSSGETCPTPDSPRPSGARVSRPFGR